MAATPILTNQFKKITTFVYILILLYVVNVIFVLKYKWDVIPIIVNVYLYVFSFYLIFNFSMIDIPPLKDEYRNMYRRFGIMILFFKTRVFPFVIVYTTTVVYTLINYLDKENWPWNPILELLDGRFFNTVFYSLILLLILKFNRRPKITLLLFVGGAAIYFLIYQLVFYFTPSGAVMSGLKILQITVGLIMLIYEFLADKIAIDVQKIRKSIIAGLLMGMFMYCCIAVTLVMLYEFASFASYPQARSAQILMRLGYSFPLKNFKSIVTETSNPYYLYDYIYYSRAYKRPVAITATEWENLILSGSMEVSNIIAFYIQYLDIDIQYQQLISYAERRSVDSGEALVNSTYYSRYMSRYCEKNMADMAERYAKGNRYFKIWLIRVTAESKSLETIPFLVTILTDINPILSLEAYLSLVKVTDVDPVKEKRERINSPKAIASFMKFYRDSRKAR